MRMRHFTLKSNHFLTTLVLVLLTVLCCKAWGASENITWDGTSLAGVSGTNVSAGSATPVDGTTYAAGTLSISGSQIVTLSKKHTNDTYWEDFSSCSTSGCTDASTTARIEFPITIADGYSFTLSKVSYTLTQGGGGGPAVHVYIVQGTTENWLGYAAASGNNQDFSPSSLTLSQGSAKLVFVLGVNSNHNSGRQFKFKNISITGTSDIVESTKKVYLKPGTNWLMKDANGDDPRYAVYYFKSEDTSDDGWVSMTLVEDCTPVYKADIPDGYDKCIFCRMLGASTENIWGNKINQTGDLTVPANGYYSVPDDWWDTSGDGYWSTKPLGVCVTGTWLRFTGETITLTATSAGAKNYQWYKGGKDEEHKIIGATSPTYTKTNCTFADAGNYYCKVWNAATDEIWSDALGVRIPRLIIQTPGAGSDREEIAFTRASETAEVATCSVNRGLAWTYEFAVDDGIETQGNNGTMTSKNCSNWTISGITWCKILTGKEGSYQFNMTFSNATYSPKMSVIYPSSNQTAGWKVYFENTLGWNNSSIYYRIGKGKYEKGSDLNWTAAQQMTLVPGTARYLMTTTTEWNDFWVWHIANNKGDVSASSYSAIYRTYSDEGYAVTESSNFNGDEITSDRTITPTGTGSIGTDPMNDNCTFYGYTTTAGMITHKASVSATTNGKIKVEYTHHDGSSQTSEAKTSRTLNNLAHTCNLTISAVPDNGYRCTSLQVNGADFTSGTTHILDANATITATFDHETYTVTLHENGGTINSGNVTTYTHGTGATLPTDITLSGKNFGGWYDNSGLSGSPITAISTTEWGNKEYWAKWEDSKFTPTFTWTYDATIKAGGTYSVNVATDGDADVTLSIKETITGVNGTFVAGKPATGTVALGSYPAAATFTYRAESNATSTYEAKSEEKTVTIERCETSNIVSYADGPINAGNSAKPRYFCETSGAGRIMKGVGSSSFSTSSSSFSGESWATKYCGANDHSLQVYKDGVFKIVLYVKSGSNSTTIKQLRYGDEYKESSGDWTDIKANAQIIYNDDPEATSITKNVQETVTIIPSFPMSKEGWLYVEFTSSTQVWGAKLYSPGGDEPTSIAFSGETEIEKYPGDAAFTKTATQTTAPIKSGASITYKSSDETVATVDKNTGEVTPLSMGHTTIAATLSAYGCFKAATASYSLVVKKCVDPVCTIAVTAGDATKCASENVTLSATAATGATLQWYKDGVAMSGKTSATLTTKEAGEYYVTATKECLQVSNTIEVVNMSAPTATALHDYYYIKAGRVTPPIKLFQLTNVETWNVSPDAPAGCAYELGEDGIVYLTGTPSATLAAGNQNITVTASNTCGFSSADATLQLRSLEATAKKQIAWIADGTKGETLPGTVDAAKSSNHALYKYLTGSATPSDPSDDWFELTSINAYCTTDERLISDYYSQFDLILLTDYPATDKSPSKEHDDRPHSYSNAIGCLIDEKPILSLEAFVAGCPNWGINTSPKTPSPDKQKGMTLLCTAHNIFAGTFPTDDKITVLSTISGEGLQGFTGLEAPPGMLFIATIENSDAKGGTLVNCCERQKVIEARMMIMGLNYNDMANLNADGQLIIKNIINYLLQYTDIADCSLVFDDNNNTHVWSDPQNWHPAYNAVPKPFQAVRVDKPCTVDVTNAHCSSIRLRKDGATYNGKLTIQPDAGLTVIDYIKEVHGSNFMTTYPSQSADLVIQANTAGQNGSLVFGNTEDDLQATVEFYSIASGAKTASPTWQYIGIPIAENPMAIDAYHAAWMCSWESEGNVSSNWVWVENEDKIRPFKGYCITQIDAKKYTHVGTLNKPEEKNLPMYYFTSDDGDGFNMFANSWVAPIDITKMETADFGDAAEATIFIYNTGTRAQYEGGGDPSTAGTNTGAGQFNAIPVKAASYLSGSLTKIPTMQGFFVQATKEGTLTLDYKKICFDGINYQTSAETMRAPKRMSAQAAAEKIVPEVMRIDVVSAAWGDRLYILTNDEFSDAFDRGWDGSKQEGDETAPMLALAHENGLLAVAAIASADERELSFRAGEDTKYTFRFEYEGEPIYLYDRDTKQATEIRTGNTYAFTANNKTPINRFLITTNPPSVPTGVESVQPSDVSLQKVMKNEQIYIIRGEEVYDITGRRLMPTEGKEGAR